MSKGYGETKPSQEKLTESRFVRDDHTRFERNGTRETVWSLVDVQERTNTMPSAVLCATTIVSDIPARLKGEDSPCNSVHLSKGPSWRERRVAHRWFPQGRPQCRWQSVIRGQLLPHERLQSKQGKRTCPCRTLVYASICSFVGKPKCTVRVVSHVPS